MGITVTKGAEVLNRVKKGKSAPLIVNDIQIRSVDRSTKDIKTWREAHRTAENVFYLDNRARLYDVYADILLDGHLSGIISKRIDAVLNKRLQFTRDNKPVDELDKLIGNSRFREIMRTILETPLWGVSGLEFIPGKEMQFVRIPRKHIKPQLGIIAREQHGIDGFDYTQLPNVWVMGEPDDLGLLLKCAPYALYKRGNLADWAQYIEIFGQPVRVIKYDAYDDQTKIELKQVLDESGSSLALMIPKQADFDLKDGKQSNGDGKLQDTFMRALNDEMSIIVLGNTETTANNRGGSNAKAEEQGRQQLEITKSDLRYVENMLNSPQFLAILQSYGWSVAGGRFEFEKEIDLQYLKDRIEIDTRIAQAVPVDDDYFYETYGIPKPKNYEELKKQKAPAPKKPAANAEEEDIDVDDNAENSARTPMAENRFFQRLYNFFVSARA